MADETNEETEVETVVDDITHDNIAQSLGLDAETDEEGTDNGGSTEEENETHGDGEENGSDGEDGDSEGGEGAGEGKTDDETASDGKDGADGEEGKEEVQLTPEHEVGAGIQKFITENLPTDRVEEGMAHFKSSLQVIANQMSGDYEGYWGGISASLEQAAIDNPEAFQKAIAPIYEQVLYGSGQLLTPEYQKAVDNMELSPEFAVQLQKKDYALKMSQGKNQFFEQKEVQSQEQTESTLHENSMVSSMTDTFQRLTSEHPQAKVTLEDITKDISDLTVSSPSEVALVIENVFLKAMNGPTNPSQRNGQNEKNPLRTSKTTTQRKVEIDPNLPTPDDIAASLGIGES